MKSITFRILLISILLTSSLVVNAQDRLFTYTYQSGVLNPGQREIEVWNTVRSGREEFYRALDSRIEFEFGVAKNLQTAFYLNSKSISQAIRSNSGLFETLEIESEIELSFSNEWKYKLSDPVASSIGSALYAEIGVAPRELELEVKLILDKKTGKITQAFNAVAESEWETELEEESPGNFEVENEFEFSFEFDYGFSYNINANWNLGFELRNLNSLEKDEWETSILYGGPGFSYAKGPIWINMTVLPQITGLKYADPDDSGTILNGHEKVETRLIFSYVF